MWKHNKAEASLPKRKHVRPRPPFHILVPQNNTFMQKRTHTFGFPYSMVVNITLGCRHPRFLSAGLRGTFWVGTPMHKWHSPCTYGYVLPICTAKKPPPVHWQSILPRGTSEEDARSSAPHQRPPPCQAVPTSCSFQGESGAFQWLQMTCCKLCLDPAVMEAAGEGIPGFCKHMESMLGASFHAEPQSMCLQPARPGVPLAPSAAGFSLAGTSHTYTPRAFCTYPEQLHTMAPHSEPLP